jgi:carbon-monoxide dehydrogenase medium subunit
MAHIAHYAVRNRGTVGGSLAHADPASEFSALAVTCEASIQVTSKTARRSVPADKFFLGPLATVLEPDELITAIHFPTWPSNRKFGIQEFARRKGDFAIAGAVVCIDQDEQGNVTAARVGGFGVADTPIVLSSAADFLLGRLLTSETCEEAAVRGVSEIEVSGDLHADAEYRRALLKTMIKRALLEAREPIIQ